MNSYCPRAGRKEIIAKEQEDRGLQEGEQWDQRGGNAARLLSCWRTEGKRDE